MPFLSVLRGGWVWGGQRAEHAKKDPLRNITGLLFSSSGPSGESGCHAQFKAAFTPAQLQSVAF